MVRQICDRTIHQVASDGYDVRLQRVYLSHDVFDEAPPNGGANVNIAQLNDDRALERRRQIPEWDLYAFYEDVGGL